MDLDTAKSDILNAKVRSTICDTADQVDVANFHSELKHRQLNIVLDYIFEQRSLHEAPLLRNVALIIR